jgi:signal transduction histidine kinase
VLFHAAREAVRNAARHGRGDHADGALKLSVGLVWRNGLEVTVEDNGVGFDTSQYASTGHGTAIHSTLMAVIGGAWVTESSPGKGTRVTLTLPEGAWQ